MSEQEAEGKTGVVNTDSRVRILALAHGRFRKLASTRPRHCGYDKSSCGLLPLWCGHMFLRTEKQFKDENLR